LQSFTLITSKGLVNVAIQYPKATQLALFYFGLGADGGRHGIGAGATY
jgi:hypothetical protein